MSGVERLAARPAWLRRLILACALLACGLALAATPPRTDTPEGTDWSHLSPQQRQALAPLQKEWPTFPTARRRKWLNIAARYPAMSPAQQAMLQRRMTEWVAMTPAQRNAARQNYLAAGRASLEARRRAWENYQKLPPAQRHELAREAKAPPKSPGHVVQYGTNHHRPPARRTSAAAAHPAPGSAPAPGVGSAPTATPKPNAAAAR